MFIRYYDLLDHLYLDHGALDTPTCSICGKSYSRQRGLDRHVNEKHHGDFNYVCKESPSCSYKVEDRSKFVRHLQDKHGAGRTFACKHCGKVRYSKSGTLVIRVGNA